jgi:AraC-like DNA-binding protein
MMLAQAIRLHLERGSQNGVGWLFALADKQLCAAMQAMHGDPARHWTLQMLAERAGMSRTIFASRFKETVGSSVMEYLSRWRMLLAGDKLRNSHASVSAIALELGYESESAFSKAFKRKMAAHHGSFPAYTITHRQLAPLRKSPRAGWSLSQVDLQSRKHSEDHLIEKDKTPNANTFGPLSASSDAGPPS